ncbi:helix-turn-helix domain containing protein [Actinomycetospora lutea]|uniref:TetR/AcrR family transcriptional regulator n=1 Tax=Actinomycetospora lutea TaxID=663604 RepID=UPI0023668C21|nr:TetR/AcrR family transcriptional regulator [Actinomycetospora lutea]MDD7937160.1 helix-turn-helix domain containing protein [Actinomycetospora lutea]
MKQQLTAHDWAAAALEALRGGAAAVAVEPLAKRLGATRGSFYWHFSSRGDLVRAALALWERRETEDVIAWVEAIDGPRERLRALLLSALRSSTDAGGADVELALQASVDDPDVAEALARVTARRLDYLAGQFAALGLDDAAARERATMAYSAFLGHAQLVHATPALAPGGDALAGYADRWIALLTEPAPVVEGAR